MASPPGTWPATGAETEVLAELPASYGQAGGVLTPLFESASVIHESDLLNGGGEDAIIPPQFPWMARLPGAPP